MMFDDVKEQVLLQSEVGLRTVDLAGNEYEDVMVSTKGNDPA